MVFNTEFLKNIIQKAQREKWKNFCMRKNGNNARIYQTIKCLHFNMHYYAYSKIHTHCDI